MKRIAAAFMCACALLLSSCATPDAMVDTKHDEKVIITALFGESTSDPGISDMLCERIERAFPQIELEWECVDWGEQFSKRLDAKIASGEIPDLLIGKAQDVNTYQAIGAIGAFPDSLAALVNEQARAAGTVSGKLYGLTYNQLYQGVLYNKNIFYRYNLTVPETTDELRKVVERLENVGVTPFATHFQETWYTGNILMQFALNEVFACTPDWGDRLRAGRSSFLSDEGYLRCVNEAQYVLAHTWSDAMGVAQSESDQRFADEEAAMYLTGSWSVQTLQAIAPYRKIGIFPYPNKNGDARLIAEPNITFMKSARTEHDALIDEIYLMLLSDTELAQTLCSFTQSDSTLKGADSSDVLAMIRGELNAYKSGERIISASVGNNQLIWSYQYDCAELFMEYLRGKRTLQSVLADWDSLRGESLPAQ